MRLESIKRGEERFFGKLWAPLEADIRSNEPPSWWKFGYGPFVRSVQEARAGRQWRAWGYATVAGTDMGLLRLGTKALVKTSGEGGPFLSEIIGNKTLSDARLLEIVKKKTLGEIQDLARAKELWQFLDPIAKARFQIEAQGRVLASLPSLRGLTLGIGGKGAPFWTGPTRAGWLGVISIGGRFPSFVKLGEQISPWSDAETGYPCGP